MALIQALKMVGRGMRSITTIVRAEIRYEA